MAAYQLSKSGAQIEKALDDATKVVANPTLAGTEATLSGLQVGNIKYAVSGGGSGSSVVVNPTGTLSQTMLSTLGVNGTNYAVSPDADKTNDEYFDSIFGGFHKSYLKGYILRSTERAVSSIEEYVKFTLEDTDIDTLKQFISDPSIPCFLYDIYGNRFSIEPTSENSGDVKVIYFNNGSFTSESIYIVSTSFSIECDPETGDPILIVNDCIVSDIASTNFTNPPDWNMNFLDYNTLNKNIVLNDSLYNAWNFYRVLATDIQNTCGIEQIMSAITESQESGEPVTLDINLDTIFKKYYCVVLSYGADHSTYNQIEITNPTFSISSLDGMGENEFHFIINKDGPLTLKFLGSIENDAETGDSRIIIGQIITGDYFGTKLSENTIIRLYNTKIEEFKTFDKNILAVNTGDELQNESESPITTWLTDNFGRETYEWWAAHGICEKDFNIELPADYYFTILYKDGTFVTSNFNKNVTKDVGDYPNYQTTGNIEWDYYRQNNISVATTSENTAELLFEFPPIDSTFSVSLSIEPDVETGDNRVVFSYFNIENPNTVDKVIVWTPEINTHLEHPALKDTSLVKDFNDIGYMELKTCLEDIAINYYEGNAHPVNKEFKVKGMYSTTLFDLFSSLDNEAVAVLIRLMLDNSGDPYNPHLVIDCDLHTSLATSEYTFETPNRIELSAAVESDAETGDMWIVVSIIDKYNTDLTDKNVPLFGSIYVWYDGYQPE